EITSHQLVELLSGRAAQAPSSEVPDRTQPSAPEAPCPEDAGWRGDVTPPLGSCLAAGAAASVQAHRLDLEALREEERAQRAAVRRRCRATAAAAASAADVEIPLRAAWEAPPSAATAEVGSEEGAILRK
ncbi:unnamed protein product, partial [Polarella glacialis]